MDRLAAENGDLLRAVEPVVGYVEGLDVVAADRCYRRGVRAFVIT
jgi:hypothetical protein